MTNEDKIMEIQNIVQEIRGLEQIAKIMSIHMGLSEKDMDDIWCIVYVLTNKWKLSLENILKEE